MTGRNEPCPCGSGIKYKKCHGKYGSKGPTNAKPRVRDTGISRIPIPIMDPRSMASAGMMTLAAIAAHSRLNKAGKGENVEKDGQQQPND
ncbi:MAG: SEC-C metal-binding domain-containing protein [Candidatus Methanoperedens sp.]|nr:SEC-C metal-binding domain-containing protein [Candidatus Methanoperedens sp.]